MSQNFITLLRGCFPIRRFLKLLRNTLDPSVSPFLLFAPPGDFSSPIPTLKDSPGLDILLDPKSKYRAGLDLRDADQVSLLDELGQFYSEMPFSDRLGNNTRYYFENNWFKAGDAIVLYGMLRRYVPKHIIEIGSGFSSAAMLDVNDLFLDHSVKFTFIEPNSERLRSLLREHDLRNTKIIESLIQQVPLDSFHELEENDILLIDSSHVAKLGSDVNHILFNILPQLDPGVLIHFHDIRWPFEYPRSATEMGIAWNEAYFLRTFLMYNYAFHIVFFNSYMAEYHSDLIRRHMPKFLDWPGGSIWIRRTG